MAIHLTSTSNLLFIGDSITDCNRRKDEPEQLGSGYVRLVRDYLLAKAAYAMPTVINRGISGNKIPDLQKRWDRDVLELKPDVLSIFIGINDVWHGLVPDRAGCDLPTYTAGYRDILTQTRERFPRCEIVLCEPSVLWLPEPSGADDLLLPYVASVHALAREFSAAAVVPLHAAFNAVRAARPDIPLTTDGVHPTPAGHMLIARTWLTATGLH